MKASPRKLNETGKKLFDAIDGETFLTTNKDVLFKYRKLNQQYDLSFENCFYSITGYLQNNAHEFENIPELFINKGLFFMNNQFNEQVLLENKKVKKPSC